MGRAVARTTITFCCVGAVSIAVGVYGAVYGTPASYGMTTAQALAVLGDTPVVWTSLWVAWAVEITIVAVWRARWLARQEPRVRFTAVRGSIWLWGAIGATWIYPWVSWDIPLYSFFDENPPDVTGSIAPAVGPFWWFGALLALPVGVIWSSTIAVARWRTAMRATADAASPPTSDAAGSPSFTVSGHERSHP
ncbi:hypothetical protein [Microbacterium sp. B19]|uniref:hypothetical protein n=1 Tax=Microbacterium sp. B19 TaxID=96765 RepID=UPI00034DB63D|nr:hypothetical protein [Microbacterium sp. B19]